MKPELGYKTHAYGDLTVDRIFKHVLACGYGCVELCMENAELSLSKLKGPHIGHIRRLLRDLNLKPCAVSIHANYMKSMGALYDIETALPLVPEMGADKLVFISGNGDPSKKAQEWKTLITRTRRLLQISKAYKLSLAVEPTPGDLVATVADAEKFLLECGEASMGLALNLGHLCITEQDPVAAARKIASSVLLVHVADVKPPQDIHLIPGEGKANLKGCIEALVQEGYRGPFIMDLPTQDPHYSAHRAMSAVKKIMDGISFEP